MIDITGIDLVKFAKKAFELSVPQGMGWLHATDTPLSDEEAKRIVSPYENDSHLALAMDYIRGRACKMTVYRKDGKLMINDSWYDHTDNQLNELLSEFDIRIAAGREHGGACNCIDCQARR